MTITTITIIGNTADDMVTKFNTQLAALADTVVFTDFQIQTQVNPKKQQQEFIATVTTDDSSAVALATDYILQAFCDEDQTAALDAFNTFQDAFGGFQAPSIFIAADINMRTNGIHVPLHIDTVQEEYCYFVVTNANNTAAEINNWPTPEVITVVATERTRAAFSTTTTTTALGGVKDIYACTDTTATRTLTISSATIAAGSPTMPFIFSINDSSGGAAANNITIDTEGGETIDGASEIFITENFGSFTLYSDGSNVFSLGA